MLKMKLSEVCLGITDGSHNPPDGIEKSDFPMISSKNIYDDKITLEGPRYLSQDDFVSEDNRTQIKPGDVLLTIVGTVGRSAVVDEDIGKITLQRSVAVLHTNYEICSSRYLMYLLQSKRCYLEQEARGVAQKGIYLKQLSNMEVAITDKSNQDRIVKVLDEVNSLIKLEQEQIKAYDDLIKSRFVELFGDPVINPFRWNKQTLGTVCDVRDGTHDSPEYFETGYPLVTSKNVTGGQIDLTTCNFISEIAYVQINERSKVDYGDIIMPMIGTVGKPVIVDIEPRFAIKNVALIKFPPQTPVQNVYIRALLESDYFDRTVLSKIRGGTQKFIALGDIRKLEILVPDIATQQRFAAFVKQVDKLKVVMQQELNETQMLHKKLMQKYFD